MNIKVKYLRRLLDELVSKHNETYEKKSFEVIGEGIKGVGDQYIYKKIAQPISTKRPEDQIGLRDSKLIALIKHLGYESLKGFISEVDNPYSSQLQSCIANYYTYLRKNTEEGYLLRSPVRIFKKDYKILMELRGQRLNYLGEMKLQNGYLTVLLQNKNGKQFYHGYKLGTMEAPPVLQGIFSGVTSTFDPIGGRVVLIRMDDEKFESLKVGELSISKMKKSKNAHEKTLAKYLEKKADNNINIHKTTSFTFGDLG